MDAACATALALGVVHPFASGLGGGGFALVHLAKRAETVALDFRETAGRSFSARTIPAQSGLSIGVPGEPAGLAELVRRYGALPFSRCVDPALRLARGFVASPWLVEQIGAELARHPDSAPALLAAVFDLGGRAAADVHAGDRLSRKRLARTLARLRTRGVRAFYTGPIARSLAAAVTRAGGALTVRDLAEYRPVARTPLATTFLGRAIFLPPPPSAGGLIVAEALGVIAARVARARPTDALAPDYLHWVAEALKHGFADRARWLGDPAFVAVPVEHLLDPAYHRELGRRTLDDHVLGHADYGTRATVAGPPARDAGTAHVSVVDRDGNAVALTTTINLEFGARVVAGDTGVLLNDELDDFSAAPGHSDVFSLTGGDANRPQPGKRPVSSMTPTIVLGENGVELVVGAAGGPRIVAATLQLVLDVLLFGRSAADAVRQPRVHHQWEPDILYYEPALAADTVRALERKGHHSQARADIAKANLIIRGQAGLDAAADPRSGGAPAGY